MDYCPIDNCIHDLYKRTGVHVCPFSRCIMTQEGFTAIFAPTLGDLTDDNNIAPHSPTEPITESG